MADENLPRPGFGVVFIVIGVLATISGVRLAWFVHSGRNEIINDSHSGGGSPIAMYATPEDGLLKAVGSGLVGACAIYQGVTVLRRRRA